MKRMLVITAMLLALATPLSVEAANVSRNITKATKASNGVSWPMKLAASIPVGLANDEMYENLRALGMTHVAIESYYSDIDQIISGNRTGLELGKKYGLWTLMMRDSRLPKDVPDEPGIERDEAIADIAAIGESYKNYSDWWLFGEDERAAEDLSRLVRVAKAFKQITGHMILNNFAPSFAPQITDFPSYMEEISRDLGPYTPLICYDNYNFIWNGDYEAWFDDLRDAMIATEANNQPLVVVVQQVPHGWPWENSGDFFFRPLNMNGEKNMEWLATQPLAFGAKGTVMMGILQSEDVPNDIFYGPTVFHRDGTPNNDLPSRYFDTAKRIAKDYKVVEWYLGNANHVESFLTGPLSPGRNFLLQTEKTSGLVGLDEDASSLTIGVFSRKNNQPLIFIANRDYINGAQIEGWIAVGMKPSGQQQVLWLDPHYRGGSARFIPMGPENDYRVDGQGRAHFKMNIGAGQGVLLTVR